jgi:hypothetical protein
MYPSLFTLVHTLLVHTSLLWGIVGALLNRRGITVHRWLFMLKSFKRLAASSIGTVPNHFSFAMAEGASHHIY